VVGSVARQPVEPADQPDDPEQQVDHAAADQEQARSVRRPGQREAGDAEEQVHEVVQHAHVEEAEELRVGVLAGEVARRVARDAGDEPEDADEQERDAEQPGDRHEQVAVAGHGPINHWVLLGSRTMVSFPCVLDPEREV
jgi:hypothetical protein